MYLINPFRFGSAPTYLLDTYSAAAAYSLRQLKTGVTNVVRVRRSGDNAESDFTATDITDGSLASWVVAGGGTQHGYTVTWYDQIGSANVTQATAGNQPQIVSSGSVLTLNSKPTITYNGSTNYLNYSTGVLNQNDLSVFSVSNSTVSSGGGAIVSFSDTTAGSLRIFCDRAVSNPVNYILSTTGTGRTIALSVIRNDANQRLLSSFIDNANGCDGYDNGNYTGTPSAPLTYTGTWTSNAIQIGRQSTGLSYLPGNVQEVIVFNTDESSNRTSIESDINTYYSIY